MNKEFYYNYFYCRLRKVYELQYAGKSKNFYRDVSFTLKRINDNDGKMMMNDDRKNYHHLKFIQTTKLAGLMEIQLEYHITKLK